MLSTDKVEDQIIQNNTLDNTYAANFIKKIKNLSKNSLLSCIGNTPLIPIELKLEELSPNIKIYAKAEWLNPGGSIKDRAAWFIIRDAILSGNIFNNDGSFRTLVDASSGNTAIGYALVASILDIKLKLFIPKNASVERIKTLKAYGVETILTDPLEGIDGAIEEVRDYVNENSECFYLDQYNNEWNWKAHYYGTGKEVLKQINNKIDYFVCCLGTTGSFMGTGRRLKKELGEKVNLVAVQPDSPFHGIEGVKHMPSSLVPGFYDESFPDSNLEISTSQAEKCTRILAKKGLFVGTSSGAALAASINVARDLTQGTIVTIFPDRGDRYLSTNLWG
ncbi:MAG: PLP-dependent cysteine synthase family protein [Candidatus Hodarchaeales archaeon]|jgi:cysteine synthase B